MNGTKRKADTSAKIANKKDSKKAKVDAKGDKKSSKPKAPVQSESSEDDFEGLDDEGGVGLDSDTEMFDGDGAPIPSASEGLHPDRAKAAANAGKLTSLRH